MAEEVMLVVGSNPPTTSGARTRARCALAATILGFNSFRIGNLVDIPTRDFLELSSLAGNRHAWVDARTLLEESLGCARLRSDGHSKDARGMHERHRGRSD